MDNCVMRKQNWDVKETEIFLQILKELDMKNCLDGRKVRNSTLFKVAQRRMTAAGFDRSVDQLKFRWKLLKSAYYKCKRQPNKQTPTKLQGWGRYEKVMVSIMESRHSLGSEVNSDRNDEVTEDSDGDQDGDASMLSWPQPLPQPLPDKSTLIVGVPLFLSIFHLCCACIHQETCLWAFSVIHNVQEKVSELTKSLE